MHARPLSHALTPLRALLATVALAAMLSGCLSAGTVTPRQQFLLSPQVEQTPGTPTAHTLGVRPLEPARPYSLPMLYRTADGALLPVPNATWAEEPAATLTRAIRDALAQTGRFADVGDAAEMARPEYALTGELRKFYEDRAASPASAVAEIRLELREALGAKLLWAQTLSVSTPVAGANPADTAAAMTASAAEIARQAAAAIAALPLP